MEPGQITALFDLSQAINPQGSEVVKYGAGEFPSPEDISTLNP
jgi:hypothetical protein